MGAKCRPEHRHQDAKVRYSLGASVLYGQSTATRSSAAGSLPLRKPAVGTSPPARLLRSRSSVRLRRGYTWPLFLQALRHFSLRAVLALHSLTLPQRCGPYSTETPQSLPGVQDTAVPAVGTDSVSHRRSVRQHTPPPRIRAARNRLCRFTPRTSDVVKYLDS